jgi:hypothetical protein
VPADDVAPQVALNDCRGGGRLNLQILRKSLTRRLRLLLVECFRNGIVHGAHRSDHIMGTVKTLENAKARSKCLRQKLARSGVVFVDLDAIFQHQGQLPAMSRSITFLPF